MLSLRKGKFANVRVRSEFMNKHDMRGPAREPQVYPMERDTLERLMFAFSAGKDSMKQAIRRAAHGTISNS